MQFAGSLFLVFLAISFFGAEGSLMMSRVGDLLWRQMQLGSGRPKMTRLAHKEMERNWAVLVAGSCGWINYRHQADVAHAYQILKKGHFLEEHIILMMCDDVANDSSNPNPGKLFNNYTHVDVYEGIKIDYRGSNVTAANFLRLMRGDQELKKEGFKVLESSENDHVFVYFTDHGAEGLIAFPEDTLFVADLKKLLFEMAAQRRYSQLVLYIEACESGSMFNFALPPNVYATTAANGHESSWACYCDDPTISSCLGDTYSVNWMEDTEFHILHKRSLQEQFEAVRNATNQSHVLQFGDHILANETLDEFEGKDAYAEVDYGSKHGIRPPPDQVSARDAQLAHYKWIIRRSNDKNKVNEALEALELYNLYLHKVEETFDSIVKLSINLASRDPKDHLIYNYFVNTNRGVSMVDQVEACYKEMCQLFFDKCYRIQKYPMVAKHLYKLKNLCLMQAKSGFLVEDLFKTIETTC